MNYFEGNVITVCAGTHRADALARAIAYTLEDYYGVYDLHDQTREEIAQFMDEENDYEMEQTLEDLTAELERLAEMHGYTFGTLEGDGAHFVLSPVRPEDFPGQWDAEGSAY